MIKISLQILFFFIIANISAAQTDTITTKDTVKSLIDTAFQKQSDLDSKINYAAKDSAVFDIASQRIFLYNKGEVVYKELRLNSGLVVIDRNSRILEAYGLPDTTDNEKFIQTPIMLQGTEKYESTMLSYNFRTKQATITKGFSNAEVGYYFGEKIKRVTPEIFFIKDGKYTTSTDKIDPEYYFFSPKMKILPRDKVFAESVFLYIEGVPVFWIPFAVFPDRRGRTSGLITPAYGTDATYGVYFSKLGYYWAINDYMDLTLSGSWFSKGRLDLNAGYQYALRYNFTGNLQLGFSRISLGESTDPDASTSIQWAASLQHSQQINPTMSLNGNLSFSSGITYYNNNTNSISDLLRQNAVSNLTLSKFWEETPFSMNLNYYRDQNLINGNLYESYPNLNFNISETFPFRSGYTTSDKAKFYEYISYSYSGSGTIVNTKTTIPRYGGADSTAQDLRAGVRHNININFTPKLSNFTIRPYFNYTEIWYPRSTEKIFNPADSTLAYNNIDKFNAVRFFQMGVSLSTKLVGIFNTKMFGIKSIRHTITPSISYNYRPDFSTPAWGYYGSYTDASGRLIKYSLYETGIYGGAPFGESQSINFSIGNLFEMKTKLNDTTDNKFQLFNINAGINYNFAADSIKWSEFRTDFRTQIGGLLNIGGGASFNLYKYDENVRGRVNSFLLSTNGRLADLTSFNINVSTSYSWNISSPAKDSTKVYDSVYVKYNIPMSGSLNYNYSENRPSPGQIFRSSNLSGNLSFSLSDKWKFTFATSYDIVNKQLSAPYLTAYRDLESWEMNFSWYPMGYYKGFKLEIRIKAPQLHDIKVDKQANPRGAYY